MSLKHGLSQITSSTARRQLSFDHFGATRALATIGVNNLLTNTRLFGTKKPGGSTGSEVKSTIEKSLIKNLKKTKPPPGNKISIIGTGAVGMGCAFALLTQNVTNQLCLVDSKPDWSEAERLDLIHGSVFLNNPCLTKVKNMKSTKNSRIVVITAGTRPVGGQTRLDVAQTTANIIKEVMPPLVENSPKAIFIVVSNPADVMTWVAQKVTGLPQERLFSSGCHLDTARFRYFIAQRLKVAPSSVSGFVIGEHGGSSVPVWSSVTVGGTLLTKLQPKIGTEEDPENWSKIHESVVKGAFDVIDVKGYTNWAIGLTIADVCRAFLENSGRVLTLATNAKGMYGIKNDIYMSLPCVCRAGGLKGIVQLPLSDWEMKALSKSADVLMEAQCSIKF